MNLISEDSIDAGEFRGYFGIKSIREALDDLEIYEDCDMFQEETPYEELPYLLIEIWCDGVCHGGYSKRRYTLRDSTELYIQEIMN